MPKKPQPNTTKLDELIARRRGADQGVGEAIAAYHAAPPMSLQRKRVAKQLAAWDEKKYTITVELEALDPAWRAAALSTCLISSARAWYKVEGLTVPEFAREAVIATEQGALFAA